MVLAVLPPITTSAWRSDARATDVRAGSGVSGSTRWDVNTAGVFGRNGMRERTGLRSSGRGELWDGGRVDERRGLGR